MINLCYSWIRLAVMKTFLTLWKPKGLVSSNYSFFIRVWIYHCWGSPTEIW